MITHIREAHLANILPGRVKTRPFYYISLECHPQIYPFIVLHRSMFASLKITVFWGLLCRPCHIENLSTVEFWFMIQNLWTSIPPWHWLTENRWNPLFHDTSPVDRYVQIWWVPVFIKNWEWRSDFVITFPLIQRWRRFKVNVEMHIKMIQLLKASHQVWMIFSNVSWGCVKWSSPYVFMML